MGAGQSRPARWAPCSSRSGRMQSSWVVVCRALVMLTFLVALPLAAITGTDARQLIVPVLECCCQLVQGPHVERHPPPIQGRARGTRRGLTGPSTAAPPPGRRWRGRRAVRSNVGAAPRHVTVALQRRQVGHAESTRRLPRHKRWTRIRRPASRRTGHPILRPWPPTVPARWRTRRPALCSPKRHWLGPICRTGSGT